jgi:DNA modification methylase
MTSSAVSPDLSARLAAYNQFLAAKMELAPSSGIPISNLTLNPLLKPHQADIVRWAVTGGRRAIFAAFGLGKSIMQIEASRLIRNHTGSRFLQVAPLGVRHDLIQDASLDTPEFRAHAATLGLDFSVLQREYAVPLQFVQKNHEVGGDGFYLTNYESVRDGKINMDLFDGVSLDEASILRGFGGTKTFRELMRIFEGTAKYRFVATATPSPNEFIELLAYAAFLDIMDVGQAKTRFFQRNSEKADQLTLLPHKEREFWLWVSSWAVFLERPSDLGYSDEGYELPPIEVHWHEVPSEHTGAGHETSGQGRLLRNAALGVTEAAKEKRESLPARIDKMMQLRALDSTAHRLIWHDLEAERKAIESAIPGVATVYGQQELDPREETIAAFSSGVIPELAAKPVMCGSGCNFQRHCAWAIFLGIGFKFNDFFQAIHRIQRFLQTKTVRIDLIYTEAEREIRRSLERKWAQHKELAAQMSAIIRHYGLASNAVHGELLRSMGCERHQVTGEHFTLVNNDTVPETMAMADNSAGLIITSIPFSTQYEYTPSYNDFGHTDSNDHFWQQMDFLVPELLRVLQPGRIAAIHVKDRIVPGGLTGLGFQTVYPFHMDCHRHFVKHGFAYLGMKTIVTDVVRENNQTYRLGWTEQCKDGSRMGVGMPEYLMLFRKPPTDSSNGYADLPVLKDKRAYSRSRWQIDAHGFARSSGDRLLSVDDLQGVKHNTIFKLFRRAQFNEVYNYEKHVELSESLERCRACGHIHTGQKECGWDDCDCKRSGGILPVTFMLLQPQSVSEDVWTDIARMRTLNGAQSAAGREQHLCPLQFDIVNRVITQYSMPGELVFDPFAGIGTVPMCAVQLGRRGYGTELSPDYYYDAIGYCSLAERQLNCPTLFNLSEVEENEDFQAEAIAG